MRIDRGLRTTSRSAMHIGGGGAAQPMSPHAVNAASAAASLSPPGLSHGGAEGAATAAAGRTAAVPAGRGPGPAAESAAREVERMIVALLGSGGDVIPSREHLQMEMFMLVRANPKLDDLFRFEPGPGGPHSARLGEASLGPLYRAGEYRAVGSGRVALTAAGRRAYEKIARENAGLGGLACAASLVRHVYDEMDADEFLFLIYNACPDTVEISGAQDGYKDPATRWRLAESLLKKGFVTEERYGELVGDGQAHHCTGRRRLLHVPV